MGISQEALMVLAEEMNSLVKDGEFDRCYLELIDHGTALALQTERRQRTCGFRFYNFGNIDLQLALDCIRGYYRKREIN